MTAAAASTDRYPADFRSSRSNAPTTRRSSALIAAFFVTHRDRLRVKPGEKVVLVTDRIVGEVGDGLPARGVDTAGTTVFELPVNGWYVLAGGRLLPKVQLAFRPQHVPAEAIAIRTEAGPVQWASPL